MKPSDDKKLLHDISETFWEIEMATNEKVSAANFWLKAFALHLKSFFGNVPIFFKVKEQYLECCSKTALLTEYFQGPMELSSDLLGMVHFQNPVNVVWEELSQVTLNTVVRKESKRPARKSQPINSDMEQSLLPLNRKRWRVTALLCFLDKIHERWEQ